MKTKCAICGVEIPLDWPRLSRGDISICMKCEGHETLVYIVSHNGGRYVEKDGDGIKSLIDEMEDGDNYTVTRRMMSTAVFLTLPEFKGF